MVRQVRGPGNLVPEDIRWITTLTPGRVERVHVRPGTEVKRGTLLLELSNPDVNIQALQAEQALTAAEARLVELRTNLETQRLNQQAAVAAVRREYEEALRQVRTNESSRGRAGLDDRAGERAGPCGEAADPVRRGAATAADPDRIDRGAAPGSA